MRSWGFQWAHAGGGVPFLMRCRRILRTCAGSVITARTFMGLRQREQVKGSVS